MEPENKREETSIPTACAMGLENKREETSIPTACAMGLENKREETSIPTACAMGLENKREETSIPTACAMGLENKREETSIPTACAMGLENKREETSIPTACAMGLENKREETSIPTACAMGLENKREETSIPTACAMGLENKREETSIPTACAMGLENKHEETSIPTVSKERFYVRNAVVPFEEDRTHEFKGHRSICDEEIPPWCVSPRDKTTKTRGPVSRNVCGFLNAGMGGTVYLGILDNGVVEGQRMTPYQMDHLLLSLQDTMDRFRPPVPRHLYHATFIPVIDKDDTYPTSFLPTTEDMRSKEHVLRTHVYCWCDYEALARFRHGIIPLGYIVEITVLPINPDSEWVREFIPDGRFNTLPVFQADDAQIYFRKHTTLVKYSSRDIAEQAKEEMLLRKMPQLIAAWKKAYTSKRLLELVEELTVTEKDSK